MTVTSTRVAKHSNALIKTYLEVLVKKTCYGSGHGVIQLRIKRQ